MLSSLTRTAGLVSFLLLRPGTTLVAHAARSSTSTSAMAGTSTSSLEEAGVIPDVLPSSFQPKLQLRVSYDRIHVRGGDQLLPVQAVHVPLVSFEGPDAGKLYTLIMYVFDGHQLVDRQRPQTSGHSQHHTQVGPRRALAHQPDAPRVAALARDGHPGGREQHRRRAPGR